MDEIFVYCAVAIAAAVFFVAAFVYANLPTKWTVGGTPPSTEFMAGAKLVLIRDEKTIDLEEKIEARQLFAEKPTFVMVIRRPGCMLCRRCASKLSAILPDIEAAGMQMIAVVLEPGGVNNFKKFFKGNVFYDDQRRFYGEKPRSFPIWMAALRVGVYMHTATSLMQGYSGDLKGEGRWLGGMFLIVSGKLAWYHLETEWGDMPDENTIREKIHDYGFHRLNV